MGTRDNGNISKINTDYANKYENREYMIKKRKRRFLFIIGFFTVIVLLLGIPTIQAHMSLNKLNTEIQASNQSLENSQVKNKKLDKQVKLLHDSTYLQKILRQKYYYSKSGETIYNLSDVDK